MLNSETKRRIDACRDVLVGKLPLPTDQVELITLFSEGIEALGHAQKAAHLPGLFRDIFRNAFL